MFAFNNFKLTKFNRIEIAFFIIYFIVLRMITDFEYNFWEKHHFGIPRSNIEYNLIYGLTGIIAFVFFYKILQRQLLNKKVWSFIAFIIVFLIAYAFYNKAIDFMLTKLPIFSDELRASALRQYQSKSIGYSFTYMFMQFLAIGSLAYFKHSLKQDQQLKVLKEQQLISELTYLKTQLQPHFFFNTLNNIYSLALQQSKETAPLVAKLAEMMRYILYKADQELVPLQDEITFISNYVEVEQIRYRSAITINFEVQGIDTQGEISPLLLLPFIENAFKHGVQEEEKNGFVEIVICKIKDELTLEVKNSIAKTKEITGGIGLANVKRRLSILYPDKHNLEIKNNGEIFEVSLTLKIK